jgi:hypothetical protein
MVQDQPGDACPTLLVIESKIRQIAANAPALEMLFNN